MFFYLIFKMTNFILYSLYVLNILFLKLWFFPILYFSLGLQISYIYQTIKIILFYSFFGLIYFFFLIIFLGIKQI